MSKYFTCPNCGADVPLKARACPECGSDKETGWSEAASYMHLLPDRGDEDKNSQSKTWQRGLIAIVAIFLLVAFLSAQGFTWSWYVIPLIALAVGAVYAVTQSGASSSGGMEKQLQQQLLRRAKGDKKLVERLIQYEQQRNPNSNRLQLLQNAIYRWDRDRR
ncbi:zinc ribbon domain-containing protein [Oculatella sp. FACHB-28]|uniref:zinc ribbon domain-containing protein n=1 Tax=Oculatella sp. FACHB-28 TaxID=2692845 RepID=UPI00168270D8|nr:zinc ribbon domain-containing protein [Oculatella sp. FACHB-28]MBD2060003.1 zinc ribbon domain-containing protein [Oculatella sp. FACHB-28]